MGGGGEFTFREEESVSEERPSSQMGERIDGCQSYLPPEFISAGKNQETPFFLVCHRPSFSLFPLLCSVCGRFPAKMAVSGIFENEPVVGEVKN